MSHRRTTVAFALAFVALLVSLPAQEPPPVSPSLFAGMKWRNIGPHRASRTVAAAGHRRQPYTFYMAAVNGGVWKTTDGGVFWHNVSDGYFRTAAVGAIAVSESDPNVIYAGTGEATIRGNVSHGDGVYRSDDAGASWRHLGLAQVQNVSRIRIHPSNCDVAWVGGFGVHSKPNPDRGVFKTTVSRRQKFKLTPDAAAEIEFCFEALKPYLKA